MSQVTYFPRYSGHENVVTNSTLHLLSQINQHSTERLRAFLGDLLGDQDLPLGISFEQQRHGGSSVPDGSILQESLHLVIETKVGSSVDPGQLVRHLDAFTKGRTGNYLILLTKVDVTPEQVSEVMAKSRETGVVFRHVTFERLCNQLEGLALAHETHLKHVTSDFQMYCSDEGLLPDRRRWLRIVPCGNSLQLNQKWGVYYQPTARGYSKHDYLGIYHRKVVRGVGRVVAVYDNADDGRGGMALRLAEGTDSADAERRVRGIVQETATALGWDVRRDHRFFCVEAFAPTDFKKTTPGGIMGARFWDVTDYLKLGTTDEGLAEALRGRTWE